MTNETFEIIEQDNSIKIEVNDSFIISEKEAIELTESIKSTATATCLLLQRAHDTKAWKAMGYNSWSEYIDNEFKFTRGRSYQLLSQASVIKEISDVSNSEIYLTEKEAKLIKKELPVITQKIEESISNVTTQTEKDEITKGIIDDEVQHALYSDKDTYNEGRDIEAMIDEDKEESGYNNSEYSQNEKIKTNIDTGISNDDTNNFYLNYLDQTLSIIEAFPEADELAKSIVTSEEDNIKERIGKSISWLEKLLASI